MQRITSRSALVLLTSLLITSFCQPANWPRFRGPNGAGIAKDQNLPVKWNQDNVLWKTKVPGAGHSSPIIWEDKVFLQSSANDGKSRMMVCVSVKDGTVLWTRSVPGTPAHRRRDNSWASSTPATDGERVYSAVWDGTQIQIFAWNLQGEMQWKTPVGRFKSQHGAGTSPVVYDGKVIIAFDQDRPNPDVPTKSSAVVALDAKTGKQVWRSPRLSFRTCYSAPFLHKNGEREELIVASTAGISAYDVKDGRETWSYTWTFVGKPLRTVGSPIYTNGLILATSGDGAGDRHAIAVKAGGKGDVTKDALVWEATKDVPYVPTPLAQGKYVFGVHDYGFARCYEAKTGKIVWQGRLSGARNSVYSSPVLVDGKIYLPSVRGRVYVFEAADKFKLLATNDLGEDVYSSPAVANQRLLIRGTEHLFCIGKK